MTRLALAKKGRGMFKSFDDLRRAVFDRDGWRCIYCNLIVDLDYESKGYHSRYATVDHRIPKCRNGPNTFENLDTCCQRCNQEKSMMSADVYLWFRHMKMRGYSIDDLLDAIDEVGWDAGEDAKTHHKIPHSTNSNITSKS